VEVIRLTPEDCALLDTRFTEYDNSQRQMEAALAGAEMPAGNDDGPGHDAPGHDAAGSAETDAAGDLVNSELLARLRALRALEHRFTIDLGSLYHRFQRRDEPTLHPLERSVLESIARWRRLDGGAIELWVFVDRVRDLRQFMDEERLHWLEPAPGEAL
jgi:hypothetical protein